MKTITVGVGFVGLTHAAVSAEFGHYVHAYDIDETRIEAYKTGQRNEIERYVNEPQLASIIKETLDRKLFFTTDISEAIEDVDIIFMCLNTPPKREGATDMTYYVTAANHLAELLAKRKKAKRVIMVNKSTVPIGTARMLKGILDEHGVENVGVASNPEFLAQGKAVEGSRRPDRVVVGADTPGDLNMLRHFYSQFVDHVRIRYIQTTPETAEAIKYISNTLLLTYISYWNGVGARVGETFDNIQMEDIKLGVTADSRISTWGSYVGNGAGGSCFGKDIQSLIYQLQQQSQSTTLLEAVYNINEYQKSYLIDRAEYEADFNFNRKKVALLGLAFKKQTNDMRDSASLKVVETLLAKGVDEIRAYDPLAMDDAKNYWFNTEKNHLFERISYHDTIIEAITDSDALYIATDWEEFRGLGDILEEVVQPPYMIIDGRRIIPERRDLADHGFTYLAPGGKLLVKREENAEDK